MRHTVGEELIVKLEKAGVRVVFGIPGVHNLELYRGLKRSSIRHVAARHEQGLGFMADGYARVSGTFGVCFTITGPGLTNIASAMGQALADSIPMLVVASENRRDELGGQRGFLHESPSQWTIGKTLSRFSAKLDDPSALDSVFAEVLEHLTGGRLGPVYLEIPRDVLGLPYDASAQQKPQARRSAVKSAIDPMRITALAERLVNATQPLLIVGGGAQRAASQVQALAEILDMPCVMTINARGILPSGHGLQLPASPSLASVRTLTQQADVVVAIGTEFGQTDFDMYAVSAFPKPAYLVRVDIDPEQLTRNVVADETYVADAGQWLDQLLKALPKQALNHTTWVKQAQSALSKSWQELNAPQQAQVNFLNALRDALPAATLIGDSTQPVYSGNLYYSALAPTRWFNSATGYGTLGYALPATNGASLAEPNRPMICLTGDGGLQFTLSELAVTRDEGIAPIIMVWNNHAFKEIRHSMLAVGIEPEGVEVKPPKLEHIAKAYELEYFAIHNLGDITKMAKRYLEQPRPMLVEVNAGEFE
jgi:acetolactate synthase I/II/III large subunit